MQKPETRQECKRVLGVSREEYESMLSADLHGDDKEGTAVLERFERASQRVSGRSDSAFVSARESARSDDT